MVTYIPYFKKERSIVIIRIIVDSDIAKVVQTGIKIELSQWDEKTRKIKNHPNQKILNQKIQNKIAELQLLITKAELLGVRLTKDRVKKIAEGTAITTDFYKHCEQWIKEKYSNPGTYRAAMSDLRKVHTFAPSLQFGDIDYRWLTRYERYLRNDLGNQGNTPWKSLKFIRTMLYDAQRIGGIVSHNPFEKKEFKMPAKVASNKDGLYIHEMDQIEKLLDEAHPVVIKIFAAKFLFMCYTGLRISDAKRFTAEHVKNNERIVITSKKTRITTNLKIHTRLAGILKKLKELPDKQISDDKFRQYLETIQKLAGITRIKVTTHTGRHSFGCLLAEMGISEEEAMELMGVKNKNVVRVYYRLRQNTIDKAADRLNQIPRIAS
jgi:integrase